MHLVQHQVPQKVNQMLMGHRDAKSTEWYTRVFALDVTRQLGVRFSMYPGERGGGCRVPLFHGADGRGMSMPAAADPDSGSDTNPLHG